MYVFFFHLASGLVLALVAISCRLCTLAQICQLKKKTVEDRNFMFMNPAATKCVADVNNIMYRHIFRGRRDNIFKTGLGLA